MIFVRELLSKHWCEFIINNTSQDCLKEIWIRTKLIKQDNMYSIINVLKLQFSQSLVCMLRRLFLSSDLLSVSLSNCLSVCLSTCLFASSCLSFSFSTDLCLSVCPFPSQLYVYLYPYVIPSVCAGGRP